MVSPSNVDTPGVKRRKSILVTEALDLIDQNHAGDLGQDEVETLLAAMGLQEEDAKKVLSTVFDGLLTTTYESVTDAILTYTCVTEGTLETMLGRVMLFKRAFRKIDIDGNSKLSFAEIVAMLESLDMEKKYAADVFSFLDADDSGEITWQEFVRGVSHERFSVLFPQITLEALVDLPSSLAQDRIVSAEEEAEAVKGLPAMEKTLYWLISLMYGPSSRSRIAPAEDEDDMTNCVARGNASEPLPGQRGLNFVSENSENSSSSSSSSSSSDSELTATTSESSHALEQVLNVNQPWPDSPYAVKSRKAREVIVITRTQPKNPDKAGW
ncbi:unnamed protein product [Symbiodinium natans]|uniref:EF-hand domain-containing protein n=1 Tax=Symbiodinium natans TaxID=878477 RepID=A0A812IA71_9DINO|nr:unnamed protein product [Symbiodinium natans]